MYSQTAASRRLSTCLSFSTGNLGTNLCVVVADWRASWLGVCAPALKGKQQKPGFTEQTSTTQGSVCAPSPPKPASPELKSLSPMLPRSIFPFITPHCCLWLEWNAKLCPGAGEQRARPFCLCERVHGGAHVCCEGKKAHNVYSDGKLQYVDSTHLFTLSAPI